MTYQIDPELAPIMAALAEQSANAPVPKRGDWRAVRATANAGLGYMATLVPPSSGVQTTTYFAKAPDGTEIEPEVRGMTLAEDVYAGLTWLVDHATELGVDVGRLAVMGESGGGGPAAGAAILARDRSVPLARQILVYPMLDDRNIAPGPIPTAVTSRSPTASSWREPAYPSSCTSIPACRTDSSVSPRPRSSPSEP